MSKVANAFRWLSLLIETLECISSVFKCLCLICNVCKKQINELKNKISHHTLWVTVLNDSPDQ